MTEDGSLVDDLCAVNLGVRQAFKMYYARQEALAQHERIVHGMNSDTLGPDVAWPIERAADAGAVRTRKM